MATSILVETKYLPPSDSSLPGLVLQVTRLTDSYMIWVGTTNGSPEDADKAAAFGNLCRDWACAMPSRASTVGIPAVSLFRSGESDVALSMAKRLAQRFGKQVFLSVDIAASFMAAGQGSSLLIEAEKGIVNAILQKI